MALTIFRKKSARQQDVFNILLIILLCYLLVAPLHAIPNGTESIITTGSAGFIENRPAIDGNHIVWVNSADPVWVVLDLLDLSSGELTQLPISDAMVFTPDQPSLFQNTAVWHEYDGVGTARVVRYDIAGATILDVYDATYESSAPEFTFPKINGNTLVWQNYNTTNSDWDITVVRDRTGEPELILDSPRSEKHPSVYGSIMVYENWTDASHSSVWQFNLSDNTSALVSGASDLETLPQIFGDRIVWQSRNITDTESRIIVWEHGVSTQLTPAGTRQEKPAVNGNRVVVEDYRRNNAIPDIYAYEYSSGWREIWVAPNNFEASQYSPAIEGNRIVWEDKRSGNSCGGCDSDIYLFTLGSSDTCPVADFLPSVNSGPDPTTLVFSDDSSGAPILYRIWNYSDGTTSYPLDPSGQVFSPSGIYHTRLTVGNLKCRNVTPAVTAHDIYIDSPPGADFTATPVEGFAPLAVQFTDISGGDPASWTWDFGDGSGSHEKNPLHTYTTAGQTYTIVLTVNNTYAAMNPDTETKTDYIRTFLGATGTSTIPVQGITVIPRYGGLFLLYNATMLPDMMTPGPTVLTAFHPGSSGWQNLTFVSPDSPGFADTFANSTYMGNVSAFYFQTEDVTASGVSPGIGTGWGVSYRLGTSRYPSPASISTAVWENTTASDRVLFRLVIIGSNFIETGKGIAYTARVVKSGISGTGNATINMSVDRSWLGGEEGNTFIIGYGINDVGNTVGSVIPARYLFDDGTLDYFEAEVPQYFTTFGIAPLSGSGNPLQLITLSVTSHVNPPAPELPSAETDSGMPGGGGGGIAPAKIIVPTTMPTPTPTQQPPDPGTSAKVYTNAQGVVSQATRLVSTDGRAVITLGEGIIALDAAGKPLEQITMKAIPAGSLPPVPPGSAFSFGGMAYEIGPDGATFSQPLSLAFMLSQAQGGLDYTVRSFDQKTGTWVDLPTTSDAATGTLTAEVPHFCCFALFTSPVTAPPTPVVTLLPVPAAPQVKAQPPTSAVSIFMSMIGWAADLMVNNSIVLAGVLILIIAAYLVRQGRFPGSGQ